MEVETIAQNLNINESDEEEDFVPKIATINSYKSLLDTDSDSENETQNHVSVSRKPQNSNEEDDENEEKSFRKSRIVSQSSESSDSEHENSKTIPEKPVKDRRKNQNPKKKILPVKVQRVSLEFFIERYLIDINISESSIESYERDRAENESQKAI